MDVRVSGRTLDAIVSHVTALIVERQQLSEITHWGGNTTTVGFS